MKTETLHKIVDFVKVATESHVGTPDKPFYIEVETANETRLGISRNLLTGQGRFYATLPLNADGTEDYSRAEEWQTLAEVADRIAVLSE
jgi:hypothetical protein